MTYDPWFRLILCLAPGLLNQRDMVLTMLKMKAISGKKSDALQILESIRGPLLLKSGYQGGQVYESVLEPDTILYLEYWSSMETFERHVQSDLYLRILAVMELSSETPQIQFHEFTDTRGMDLIRRLRQRSEPNHESSFESRGDKSYE